jgi:hypothetical protein
MTADTTDPNTDGYCELHGFKQIGEVGSWCGVFAIVEIGTGRHLADWWEDIVGINIPVDAAHGGELVAARQRLEQFNMTQSHEVRFDGWKGFEEDGVVVNTEQGIFPVYARYCDRYGSGHMSICELRIDLHRHDEDDE